MMGERVMLKLGAAAAVLVMLPTWGGAFDPQAGDYGRHLPTDVRVMSYNTEVQFLRNEQADVRFARILQALEPDIIVFEELQDTMTTTELADRLGVIFDSPPWNVHFGTGSFIKCAVVSRYPLNLRRTDTIPNSSTRGVTMTLVDLPDDVYTHDIYVMGVHLKCCNTDGDEDISRQRSADAIASWFGDARTPGGNITLPDGTPMFVAGDFNLVGGRQPDVTIRLGDIQDNATFGPDIRPDWDDSNNTDLIPTDPFTGGTNTWRSSTTNPTSRLDRIYYTDSVVTVPASAIFNPLNMPGGVIAALGIQSNDASSAADHLPIFADFRVGLVAEEGRQDLWMLH